MLKDKDLGTQKQGNFYILLLLLSDWVYTCQARAVTELSP